MIKPFHTGGPTRKLFRAPVMKAVLLVAAGKGTEAQKILQNAKVPEKFLHDEYYR